MVSFKKRVGLPTLFAIILAFTGCTTFRDARQRVKIVSNPVGATIYEDGDILGVTPAFLDLRRRKHKKLVLEKPGFLKEELQLPTSYRWADSFFSDFVWFNYAPAAWLLDVLSEKAWDYDKIPIVDLKPSSSEALLGAQTDKGKLSRASRRRGKNEAMGDVPIENLKIAIAPPQVSPELLADEIGEKIEIEVRRLYPTAKIRPYRETQGEFGNYEYLNDKLVAPELRDDLYFSLKTTHVIESEVLTDPAVGFMAKCHLNNVFSEKTERNFDLIVKNAELEHEKRDPWTRRFLSLVSIVPNTVTFDTSSANARIYVDGFGATPELARYYSTTDKSPDLLSYISGIGLRNSRNPGLVKKTAFTFRFVPSLGIYYDRFRFETQSPLTSELSGKLFYWYIFEGGVGPQVGLESVLGHQYFQIVPVFSVNWVQWNQYGDQQNFVQGAMAIEAELGWSFFVSEHFNFRLYSRALTSLTSPWNSVLSQAVGRSVYVTSTSQIVGGLAVGYYFPEGRNYVKDWVRH